MADLFDHASRMKRAILSLDGLSAGDSFGQQFFVAESEVLHRLSSRTLPRPDWCWTDDTAMALSILEELDARGCIDQDSLAYRFADRHSVDPMRGYGAGARQILTAIAQGTNWREASSRAFEGQGSLGNGGAMRAGPIGAYFADSPEEVGRQAQLSAQVTHYHPEGQAGAIAVAIAAAYVWRSSSQGQVTGSNLLEEVEAVVPPGETRLGIRKAIHMGLAASVPHAAAVLGVGHRVSAPDTVPFALWCAARHLDNFEEALWTTVSGLGDRDTTCAMVGSIVVLNSSGRGVPPNWIESREPYPKGFVTVERYK